MPSTSRRRPLHRACADHHVQPWWYSARDATDHPGRFDLARPHGTCYWALEPATAIIEATTDPDQVDPPVVTVAALQRLAMWAADDVPTARSRLANTTIPSVPELTGEIATIVPYDLPWAWADAFHADGRHGVLYRARLGMGEAVALFGPHGVSDDAPTAERTTATSHLDDLPAAFLAGVETVGPLASLPRADPPS